MEECVGCSEERSRGNYFSCMLMVAMSVMSVVMNDYDVHQASLCGLQGQPQEVRSGGYSSGGGGSCRCSEDITIMLLKSEHIDTQRFLCC